MKNTIVSVFYNGERPSGPIEGPLTSKCGKSEGGLTAKCLPPEFFNNIRDAEKADKFIEDYTGNADNLFNAREMKTNFDGIVRNWGKISNTSVQKVKDLVRIYTKNEGIDLQNNFKLSPTNYQGNPGLRIEGTGLVIFNGGDKSISQNNGVDTKLLKADEKTSSIVLDNGKSIQLVENSGKDGYMDGSYGYRAIIISGRRYELTSIERYRDGGTTVSRFQGAGRTFELYQPTGFAKNKKPTLTEE